MHRQDCSLENYPACRVSCTACTFLSGSPPCLLGPAASQSRSALTRQMLWAGRRAALLHAGFPAGHRWTDRQALAAGVGQVGGEQPWSLVDWPRPGRTGSLWEEGVGAALAQALGRWLSPWSRLCISFRLPHSTSHITPTPESAAVELIYLNTEAGEVEFAPPITALGSGGFALPPPRFSVDILRETLFGAKVIHRKTQTSRSLQELN